MKFRRELILVYQMGKVGSSSLEKAIPGALHIHTLFGGRYWLLRRFDKRRLGVRFVTALRLLKLRCELKFARSVKIVTLVRSPHARNMSWFFQRLYVDLNYFYQDNNVDPRVAEFQVLFSAFEYNAKRLENYLFDSWFEKEFKSGSAIDVFSKPYDFDKGYTTYVKGNTEVFLTRYEDLNASVGELAKFLGVNIDLKNENNSSSKWYSALYSDFKKNYVPSKEYLNEMRNSRTYRHFYSGDESSCKEL
jgi:hypothetical protein